MLQEKKAETELELKKEKKRLLENFIKMRDENKKVMKLYQKVAERSAQNSERNFMNQSRNANEISDF